MDRTRPLIICKGMLLDTLYVRAAKVTERKEMIWVGRAIYIKSNHWQLPKHMRQPSTEGSRIPASVGYHTQVQLLNCPFLSLRSQHSHLCQSFIHSCHCKEHQPQWTCSLTQQTLGLFSLPVSFEVQSHQWLCWGWSGGKILATVLQAKTFPSRR